jgi:hypothetical protein
MSASSKRDERVEHDGYDEQEPAAVARPLKDAAALFANVLPRLPGDVWQRTVIYICPERSLRWVALHQVRHHRPDIGRQG